MNVFQRAREQARTARALLLKQLTNEPVVSADILKAIETELQLAIETVDPSFAALGGGSAVLKRDERFIYVSAAVEPDKHAALVAHELGHWYLDADKTPVTVAHLASVTAGAGSQAVISVEAYGARERQELQANVFARELLLPQALARSLFAKGHGASRIATDLHVPIEYVRQQLLDALLLPPSNAPDVKVLHPASKDQKAAAQAAERFANVVAGPGTGKTSTLIHRVKFLIEERKVDPAHILVVTFTNKAAFELIERLKSAGISRAADIWAGTFHAFGLEFLRKYHQRFGLDATLNVADTMSSMTTLVTALPGIKLKHFLRVQDPYEWLHPVVRAIKRLKEELISPAEYRFRVSTLAVDCEETRLRREDVATLYEAHEALLAKSKMVDFVDLVAKPALAIRGDRAPYSELADKFQYVLIDEYQDVTVAMIELMKQLARKAKSLWVVGDVRQAIHHWRGASVHSLIEFDATFKAEAGTGKIQKYALERNRRSSAEILDLIEQAGKVHALETSLPLDKMVSDRGKTGMLPVLLTADSHDAIPPAVISAIQHCHSAGVRYGDQTVLCRGSDDRESMASFLSAHGVPILYVGELGRRVEIKRILCLMQLLTERQPKALVGLVGLKELALSRKDIDKLLAAAGSSIRWQRGRWLEDPPPGISAKGLKAIAAIRALLRGFSRHSNPWHFVCELLLERRFELPDAKDSSIPTWMSRIALWQFAYSVRSGDGEIKQARLPRFLMRQRLRQRIGETYAERELPPEAMALDAVRVQTIHGSKGLEYDAVHVAYANAGNFGAAKPTFPDPTSILDIVPPEAIGSNLQKWEFEQAVERNNLFYVALSRAKRYLYIYENAEFLPKDRAPQLAHYPPKYKHCSFTAPASDSADAPHIISGKLPPIEFERFETFARCPLQYSYRYELKLRREEDSDVAIRARWAIMSALGTVAKGTHTAVDEVFQIEWNARLLPEAIADSALWADAQLVYDRGLAKIQQFRAAGGVYSSPQTTIAGIAIILPWGFSVAENYATTFHLIRYAGQGLAQTATLLRPALAGMPGQGQRKMTLHALLPSATLAVQPTKAVEKTLGFRAAVRFQEGRRMAMPGRVCARCEFLTLCPLTPALPKP